jgi:hypothetical protein
MVKTRNPIIEHIAKQRAPWESYDANEIVFMIQTPCFEMRLQSICSCINLIKGVMFDKLYVSSGPVVCVHPNRASRSFWLKVFTRTGQGITRQTMNFRNAAMQTLYSHTGVTGSICLLLIVHRIAGLILVSYTA